MIRKRCIMYTEHARPMLILSIILIFIILFAVQPVYASKSTNIDPAKLHLSDVQQSMGPYGANIGRIILYSIVIVIVIVTRLKWTKHGREVTNTKIIRVYFLLSIKFYCSIRFSL